MQDTEVWRQVEGHPDYSVSNHGRVVSRKWVKWGKEPMIIKPVNTHGYAYVCLCKNNQFKRVRIHRLVAQAFIPNPRNLPIINHRDSNKSNNYWLNLEWCDQAHNIQHALAAGSFENLRFKRMKPVVCIETGEVFLGFKQAANTLGVGPSAISQALKNNWRTCGGYHWRLANEGELSRLHNDS